MTDEKTFRRFLAAGENETVEFKRCSNGVRDDTFETVCSFLNGEGGDIFLGVEDGGAIRGIAEDAAASIVANIIRTVANPAFFKPCVRLVPEIFKVSSKTLIRIRVPAGEGVTYSYKGFSFVRVDDADVKNIPRDKSSSPRNSVV